MDEKLKELENVRIFTDFVHSFTQFGADMVELAHVSGDRQNVSVYTIVDCYLWQVMSAWSDAPVVECLPHNR